MEELVAGDIGATVKLKNTRTANTLNGKNNNYFDLILKLPNSTLGVFLFSNLNNNNTFRLFIKKIKYLLLSSKFLLTFASLTFNIYSYGN